MKIAFVYPGQGAQYVGMGKDLFEAYPDLKDIYLKADNILGFELSSVSFEGPAEKLKQTYVTQPAIFTHSVCLTKILGKKLSADFAAGHSLGEYSALVYAGALTFDEGLKLVKLRGELMQKAGEQQKGTMAAIMGLGPQKLEELCREASSAGIVQVANFNSPGQIVISGSVDGVRKAMELAREAKAKLVKELLYNQLTSSVRWEESITNMIHDGAEEFVEIGPGKVLQGLIKRIDGNVAVRGFDKAEDLNKLE